MNNDLLTWSSIAPYLDQALDLEPSARAAWLDELEATHAEMARSVRQLLAERDALNAKGFLSGSSLPQTRLDTLMPALAEVLRQRAGVESGDWLQGPPNLSTADRREQDGIAAGAVLGPYRLLREIGLGGMSSVWLAERCDGQFNREVALKLPFAGPHYAQIAERFKRERDILAALTHPNIARLYDAGIGASGQSYLAMEYVHGTVLTRYCDTARLTVRQRLTLFLQVLAAVEFAHTHLVLHRDLKPSNIQVTEEGRVVLLDFGIAKLLSPETSAESPQTEMAARMLTPDYASPEHLAGSALWTTSDVYSLGVVLFELLAGARPFGEEQQSRRDIEEAILTRDPPRPSQFALSEAIAAARHTTPRKLAQALKGDLDTIILKALKKSPAERYQSIDAFARDIANYLSNLPVSARPDSAWYRTRRFVSRYKWQVAAAFVTSLSIIIGAGTAVWQAQATAQQRDRALALASRNRAINDFTSMLIGEAASSEKPVTVKEMLARSETLALAGTVGDSGDRAAVLETIADLHIAAGDPGKSVQVLESALALAADARDARLKSRLICLHAMMIADMGKADAAVGIIKSELEHLESDAETAASCWNGLANVLRRTGDTEGTLRYALLALERFRQTPHGAPADEAELLETVGYGYRLNRDNAQANRYYELALKKYTDVGREHSPNALMMLNNWALVSSNSGVPKHALEIYDRILGILTARDPSAALPPALIFNRARALEIIGRFSEARAAYESSLQLGSQAKNIVAEGMALAALAGLAVQFGDRPAAAQYLRQFDERLGSSLSSYGALKTRRALVQGRLDIAEGKLAQARSQLDTELGESKKNASGGNLARFGVLLAKAEAELMSGDPAAAIASATAVRDIYVGMQGGVPYSSYTGQSWLLLGRALQAHGETGPAREAFETAVLHLSNTVDADHPDLVRARELLAAMPHR